MTFTEGLQFHKYDEDSLRELNKVLARHPQLSVFRRDVIQRDLLAPSASVLQPINSDENFEAEVHDREQFEFTGDASAAQPLCL